MQQYKKDFIELLVKAQALKFGEFTLKSGRIAPYFMNAGSFYTGELVSNLGAAYAGAYLENGIIADVIFGPAYKGIPLAVSMVSQLSSKFQKNISYCFNRKEVKDHGDGGLFVGASLNEETRVLIVDDVMTAGTAVKETVELLRANGNPKIEGVLISFNRMEKNNEGINAVEAVEKEFGFKVYSIVDLDDVIEVLYNKEVEGTIYIDDEKMQKIKQYRIQYGV